ncbi:hypothetical protein [Saccharolobus caldissimus]|uniref:tRNA intron endonuclease catalytic domain-containing protein n=1 Tax=Saccharolobus caldissimus TaxID=1702097 RepID=A0AAQ4CMY9_9CREN|nr:hypothetical protein [Saccharolobus caldissimus]BDB97170.1 hypothetical protein SACC_01870 [Saccharolobus caldissimus]
MSESNESVLAKIYEILNSTKQISDNLIYSVNWNKLDVYVDLRQRGRVVEDGIDDRTLIIKDKGSGKYKAMIMIIDENEKINFKQILDKLYQSKSMDMELYISIVDKYGDITYYSLSEIKMIK